MHLLLPALGALPSSLPPQPYPSSSPLPTPQNPLGSHSEQPHTDGIFLSWKSHWQLLSALHQLVCSRSVASKLGWFRPTVKNTYFFISVHSPSPNTQSDTHTSNEQSFMHRCAVLSRFSHAWHFATLLTVTGQASLSKGLSRQEYWSGLPCPPPGDLPDPGIELASPVSSALAGGFSTTSATWEAHSRCK